MDKASSTIRRFAGRNEALMFVLFPGESATPFLQKAKMRIAVFLDTKGTDRL